MNPTRASSWGAVGEEEEGDHITEPVSSVQSPWIEPYEVAISLAAWMTLCW